MSNPISLQCDRQTKAVASVQHRVSARVDGGLCVRAGHSDLDTESLGVCRRNSSNYPTFEHAPTRQASIPISIIGGAAMTGVALRSLGLTLSRIIRHLREKPLQSLF